MFLLVFLPSSTLPPNSTHYRLQGEPMSRLYDALELARKKKIMQEKPSEMPLPKIYSTQEALHDMEEEMLIPLPKHNGAPPGYCATNYPFYRIPIK